MDEDRKPPPPSKISGGVSFIRVFDRYQWYFWDLNASNWSHFSEFSMDIPNRNRPPGSSKGIPFWPYHCLKLIFLMKKPGRKTHIHRGGAAFLRHILIGSNANANRWLALMLNLILKHPVLCRYQNRLATWSYAVSTIESCSSDSCRLSFSM